MNDSKQEKNYSDLENYLKDLEKRMNVSICTIYWYSHANDCIHSYN